MFFVRIQLLTICSTVLLPALKPACSSDSSSAIRLRWFWIRYLQPDFARVNQQADGPIVLALLAVDFFFWEGVCWVIPSILWAIVCSPRLFNSTVRAFTIFSLPCFINSAGTLSAPGDFPLFRLLTAGLTSSHMTARSAGPLFAVMHLVLKILVIKCQWSWAFRLLYIIRRDKCRLHVANRSRHN